MAFDASAGGNTMLNERLAAANQVAAKLRSLEEAIDDAIICAAELVAATPKARRGANLSATVGHEAMALSSETLAALHLARSKIVAAHHEFADVRNQIGLTPKMTGDLWKLVEKGKDEADAPAVMQVVA